MSDNMRASFEKWAADYGLDLDTIQSAPTYVYVSAVTDDHWDTWQAAYNMQQAVIDSLMLEFCPDEMTEEQMETWAKYQKQAPEEYQK